MAGAKAKVPAPIDRPLSRAYLRTFTGWSTAYPPGLSEPTSLRKMENLYVDRNGALCVRPGLKYLSFATTPDSNPDIDGDPGVAVDRPMVGTQEPFYITTGDEAQRCLLFAVRELDNTVGFRCMLFTGILPVVHHLTDVEIGFYIPQGEPAIAFSADTTHVEYLQIDNKILALSDAGEEVRLFNVGAKLSAKRLGAISMPQWEDTQKLRVVHPDSAWTNLQGLTTRRNELYNPSFEAGGAYWARSVAGAWRTVTSSPNSGTVRLELSSAPARHNIIHAPLTRVTTPSIGIMGWYSDKTYGTPKLSVDGAYLKITDAAGPGNFRAYAAKMNRGADANTSYKVALDFAQGSAVDPFIQIGFYSASGALIGSMKTFWIPGSSGRYVSPAFTSPNGTTVMRLHVGGKNTGKGSTYVKVKSVVFCEADQSTTAFDGTSGTNYFWTGTAHKSSSVYHPPQDVSITSHRVPVKATKSFYASIFVTSTLAKNWALRVRSFDKDVKEVFGVDANGATTAGGGWVRASAGTAGASATSVSANFTITFPALARNELVFLDSAMIEVGVVAPNLYFDGSTPATATTTNSWADKTKPHHIYSVQSIKNVSTPTPAAETPTTKTLIASGGSAANPYKLALFYTFENEIGESFPSKIREIRTVRPWSNWNWETPNATGEPSGVPTDVAELCADQLVCTIPQEVYDQAVLDGALRWNLYAASWSDQDPVPVLAQLVSSKDIYPEDLGNQPAAFADAGWMALTPRRGAGLNEMILPTAANRENSSTPPRSRNGLVAGDRMILLGDPVAGMATIRWTSNKPGAYTNFSPSKNGGSKTLTSGNLNIPASVVLWQNPQSVDTLTVLCLGVDGMSVSYYMQPAVINAQSAATQVMGFEETTSTAGTVTPYGNDVLNNALFRPTDKSLLKSTASNYNISHKPQSDKIENMWRALRSKEWIMSAQLNNRLYYLVHNPYGENLLPGCKGNEIWVYDIAGEAGSWSRWLVQGLALRVVTVGAKDFLAVTKPEGLFYMDQDQRRDEYVVQDSTSADYLKVLTQPIPWSLETNTQGANRAHDAWAHLQFIQITLGNFQGTMKYGVRGLDTNGFVINAEKTMSDFGDLPTDGTSWDVDDALQVRRDMKEWFFYASSVDGLDGVGQLNFVQYRYTPVSVNIGYEMGSVETFEYGANVAEGANGYSVNGIVRNTLDYSRP